jgi:transcriptional regulator with XRE-family HTH domain
MGIGRNMKLIRTARDTTLSDLASKVGVTASYLSLVENERRKPSLKTLEAIAHSLGVHTSILLWEKPEGAAQGPTPREGLLSALYRILEEMDELVNQEKHPPEEHPVNSDAEPQAAR